MCVMGDLQGRGVQSTGCSAWRWALCCRGSPGPPRRMGPTAPGNTAPSRSPHRTHTGRFHGTLGGGGLREGKLLLGGQSSEGQSIGSVVLKKVISLALRSRVGGVSSHPGATEDDDDDDDDGLCYLLMAVKYFCRYPVSTWVLQSSS